jgi:tetratricopeptide (TPR) repeat protein
MNWNDYEKQIFEYLKGIYPDTTILYNQKIKGKNSKQLRQIDILIEGYIAGKKIRIIVDTKFFTAKIDVKDVEAFISMVQDVDAKQGILITNKGYTQAAINTAHFGTTDIELDVFNIDELKHFQSTKAIIYAGEHGAIIPAPFGWVVDGTIRDGLLATLYQRGLNFEEAARNKEFIYVNLFHKENNIITIESLMRLQELDIKSKYQDAVFEYDRSINRIDKAKTALRTITIDNYPTDEYTGFVEFNAFFVFFVLFTPPELKAKNLRKLETLLQRVLPLNVNQDATYKRRLNELILQFKHLTDKSEKASLLCMQGALHLKLKDFISADKNFMESIELVPTNYGGLKGRLEVALLTNIIEKDTMIRLMNIINLSPTNPSILFEISELYRQTNRATEIQSTFLYAINKLKGNFEAIGNIYFHIGQNMKFYENNSEEAKRYFKLSEKAFKKCFSSDHHVFTVINESISLVKYKSKL